MSTSRSSKDKDKEDTIRKNRTHAHDRKRRHSSDSDYGYRKFSRDKDQSSRRDDERDALTAFRAEITEDEARNYRSRHPDADPTFYDDARRKRHHKLEHDRDDSRRREPTDSRIYKENRKHSDKCRDDRDVVRPASYKRTRSPDPDSSRGYASRSDLTSGDADLQGASSREHDNKHPYRRRPLSEDHQKEKRGRSLSKSSSSLSKDNLKHPSSRSPSTSSTGSYHDSYKRKRLKTRSRSRSRDRKDGKSRKHKRSSSRKKDRNRDKGEDRRSILTGKKIKLKVKKDKGDHERDANRQELLKFLNSAFE